MRSASSSYNGEAGIPPGGFLRTIFLLPLTALVAVVAGCRSNVREQTAGSLPPRDLTLVAQTPGVAIASPVEMPQLRVERRSRRPSQSVVRQASATYSSRDPKVIPAAEAVPAPVPPVSEPTRTAPTPANDRELLPGKTVTLIPASSGPSAGSDRTAELPAARGHTIVARGGGTCRGRGRGPGIGGAPRPGFR
jgi:hypothetical protein